MAVKSCISSSGGSFYLNDLERFVNILFFFLNDARKTRTLSLTNNEPFFFLLLALAFTIPYSKVKCASVLLGKINNLWRSTSCSFIPFQHLSWPQLLQCGFRKRKCWFAFYIVAIPVHFSRVSPLNVTFYELSSPVFLIWRMIILPLLGTQRYSVSEYVFHVIILTTKFAFVCVVQTRASQRSHPNFP